MRAAVYVIHPPALNCCMLSLPSFILSLIHISANNQELTMRWEVLTHDLPFVHVCGSVWERESVCVRLRVRGLPSRSTAGERRVKQRSLKLLGSSITPPDQHPHAGSARATHQLASLWNSNKRKKAGVAEINWNSYRRGIKQTYGVTAKQHMLSSPNSFSCKRLCLTPLIHPFFPPSLSLSF